MDVYWVRDHLQPQINDLHRRLLALECKGSKMLAVHTDDHLLDSHFNGEV